LCAYPAPTPGAADSSDRGLFIAVSAVVMSGVLALGIGVRAVLRPGSDFFAPGRHGAGLIGGPVLISLAIVELVRRRRQGPQKPGRHTR
jgi:hypothetical protein